MINRDQTFQKINELIENNNLVKHCLAVEAAMLWYADYFKVSPSERIEWGIVGLIHDADWEKYPSQHPRVIVEWLEQQGASDAICNAVSAHGIDFGVEPKTLMAKTLRGVDELSGFIVAVTLVRESRRLSDVTVDSVLKKLKTSGFAKNINRDHISIGAEQLDIDLPQHISNTIDAMNAVSTELGL